MAQAMVSSNNNQNTPLNTREKKKRIIMAETENNKSLKTNFNVLTTMYPLIIHGLKRLSLVYIMRKTPKVLNQ